ncbi:MAG: MliC family protein [Elainellaceae cyanobacterium]
MARFAKLPTAASSTAALLAVLTLLGCDRLSTPDASDQTDQPISTSQGYSVTYQCRDDVTFTARLTEREAIADLPEKPGLTLPRVGSASGAKYSDGTITLWDKGGEAFVETNGVMMLVDCRASESIPIGTDSEPSQPAEASAPESTTAEPEATAFNALCDIYPTGSDQASASLPCAFSQRQGYVYITREDGVAHVLNPVGDQPGSYTDQDGQEAYRQAGLGDSGQIYQMADETIYLYWKSPLSSADPNEPVSNEAAPSPSRQNQAAPNQAARPTQPSGPVANSQAPCNTDPEATFEAENYFVYICRRSGQLRYIGVEKGSANSLVTDDVTPIEDGYVAVNGDYEYQVSPSELVVYRIENGEYIELGREAMLRTIRPGE